jgi:hypothetical protein
VKSTGLSLFSPFQAFDPIKQIVTKGECGVTKGCFLHPSGCTESNCEYLLTYRVNGDFIDFEMSARTTGYISVGFSYDKLMVSTVNS